MKNIFFILIIFFPLLLTSQILIHRHISIDDGLVQSNINNIYEDPEGYLWFATMDGISRWDGIEFVNFTTSQGLPASQVYQIYGAPDSSIYFATYGGGICRIKNNKLEKVFPELTKYDPDLACINADDKGNFYVGGYNGISMINRKGNLEIIEDSTAIWAMSKGSGGTFYFGSYLSGFKVLHEGKWKKYMKKDGLPDNAIWSILESSNGKLFVATNKGAAVKAGDKFVSLTDKCDILDSRIVSLYEDHSGGIYFGGTKGVAYLRDGKCKKISTGNGMSLNDVWSFHEDRFGLIYFGTGGNGVDIYRPGVIENYTKETGLNDNVVRAIYVEPSGKKYFGSDAGITIMDNGKITYLTEENGLIDNKVRKIISDGEGRIYIATRSGLTVLENGEIHSFNKENGLIEDKIMTLYYGRKSGNIYIGTIRGVSIFKDGKILKNYGRSNGMVDDYINCAYEDSKGDAYFGTYLGVAIYRQGKWDTLTVKDGLAGPKIVSVFGDENGRIFFGTYGKGVSILNTDGKIINLDMNSGLINNSIWSITEDKMHNIYLATGKGVTILRNGNWDSSSIRYLTQADGLASSENNHNAAFADDTGKIWFGTVAGASCYDPSKDKPVKIPPSMHLKEIRLFDKTISRDKSEFNYDENFLNFYYVGIYFPAPEKVTYYYRLAGLEKTFKQTNERLAKYTNLDPGEYEFIVSAESPWGVKSNVIKYAFVILPPFWATWWFRILMLFLFVSILYVLYRIKINRIIQIERLRTGIAGDLHDEVGSSLTKIFMGAEVIQNSDDMDTIIRTAERIGKSSREMLQVFSDIIWGIEARNDTLENLLNRMHDFAYKMLEEKGVEIKFRVDVSDVKKYIPGKTRQNIYLIFKEALNNILKHSDADKIFIHFAKKGKQYILKVKDNGKPVDITGTLGGFGIRSMQRRAEEIGGKLLIENKEGFSVTLIVTL